MLLFLFCRWENREFKELSNVPTVTELVTRARIHMQLCAASKPKFLPTLLHYLLLATENDSTEHPHTYCNSNEYSQ